MTADRTGAMKRAIYFVKKKEKKACNNCNKGYNEWGALTVVKFVGDLLFYNPHNVYYC